MKRGNKKWIGVTMSALLAVSLAAAPVLAQEEQAPDNITVTQAEAVGEDTEDTGSVYAVDETGTQSEESAETDEAGADAGSDEETGSAEDADEDTASDTETEAAEDAADGSDADGDDDASEDMDVEDGDAQTEASAETVLPAEKTGTTADLKDINTKTDAEAASDEEAEIEAEEDAEVYGVTVNGTAFDSKTAVDGLAIDSAHTAFYDADTNTVTCYGSAGDLTIVGDGGTNIEIIDDDVAVKGSLTITGAGNVSVTGGGYGAISESANITASGNVDIRAYSSAAPAVDGSLTVSAGGSVTISNAGNAVAGDLSVKAGDYVDITSEATAVAGDAKISCSNTLTIYGGSTAVEGDLTVGGTGLSDITIQGGGTNTIGGSADITGGDYVQIDNLGSGRAVYGDLTISGSGTVFVSAESEAAVYGSADIQADDVNISAGGYGVGGNLSFSGRSLNITANGNYCGVDDDADITASASVNISSVGGKAVGGSLTINKAGDVNLTSEESFAVNAADITASGDVVISGSKTAVESELVFSQGDGLSYVVVGDDEALLADKTAGSIYGDEPSDEYIEIHPMTAMETVEATCTESGSEGGRMCPNCGWVYEDPEQTESLGHIDADGDGICDRCGEGLESAYTVRRGADSQWTKGSTDGLTFVTDGLDNQLVSVTIDGETVTVSHSPAGDVNNFVLSPELLESLAVGKHTICFNYDDGSARTTFEILEADSSDGNGVIHPGSNSKNHSTPDTSDTYYTVKRYFFLALATVITIAALAFGTYKAQKDEEAKKTFGDVKKRRTGNIERKNKGSNN